MNYRIFYLIISCLFLFSCNQTSFDNSKKINIEIKNKYKNSGFALISNDELKDIKKLDFRSLEIYHNTLKKKSVVKITNPKNSKYLLATVKSNRIKFSNFYNSVLSLRIAEELELDFNEPYIEMILVSKNSTFIAKKAKMFDEEKQVAEKAPVEGISINDLSLNKEKNKKKQKKDEFKYIIKIADFYYEKTAILMQNRIKDELKLKNSKISKISNTSFRVYFGPFDNLKSIKEIFDDITPLNFENIEILKL